MVCEVTQNMQCYFLQFSLLFQCEHLENNGFESIIVTVGKSGNVNMGSARGKLFLDDRLAFITDFINFCKGNYRMLGTTYAT